MDTMDTEGATLTQDERIFMSIPDTKIVDGPVVRYPCGICGLKGVDSKKPPTYIHPTREDRLRGTTLWINACDRQMNPIHICPYCFARCLMETLQVLLVDHLESTPESWRDASA